MLRKHGHAYSCQIRKEDVCYRSEEKAEAGESDISNGAVMSGECGTVIKPRSTVRSKTACSVFTLSGGRVSEGDRKS